MESQNFVAGAMRVLERGREMFANEANRGNDNTLWETMASCIRGLSRRFASQSGADERPMEVTIAEIHNVWFVFTLAASNIDADHPAQDRLVRVILWARESGTVTRIQDGVPKPVITADGQLWTDLPYLVEHIRTTWEAAISTTHSPDPAKARNLAAGISRLAGLGVCGEALTGCALDIMARTLEDNGDGGTTAFTLPQLLSFVEVWLRYAGDKLLMLSDQHQAIGPRWSGIGTATLERGKTAAEAGPEVDGLGRDRVLRWRRRLAELKSHSDDDETSIASGRCLDMLEWCCLSQYGKGIEAWASEETFDI